MALDRYCCGDRGIGCWGRHWRRQREQDPDDDTDGDCHNSVRPHRARPNEDRARPNEDRHASRTTASDADRDADGDGYRNEDDYQATAATAATAGLQRRDPCPPRGPSGADGTYNCSDFDTQQQAQDYYDQAGDIDGLDANYDGVPCESLP